jgi:phosphoglycolate phosphatase-like HAD superfamily hydrolase
MTDPTAILTGHQPAHEFLVCIDSDGCVFDTMELKHKECFIPQIIHHFGLQPVSKFVRAAAEFVNLYSVHRGINRFPALVETFDLLMAWDKVQERGVAIPPIPNLRRWVKEETKLGNPALKAHCAAHPDQADMQRTLAWSEAVNRIIDEIVAGGVPPFPCVKEVLAAAQPRADMMVCSQTPTAALRKEWDEQGVASYVFAIAGQELGTKADHIRLAAQGRYAPERILMVGDAPGDRKAAAANGALFYPINPGAEEASWARFHAEALDRFFAGTFAGDYQAALIAEFEGYLPATPPWRRA